MTRVIASDGGLALRDATPIRIDARDLDDNGRPRHVAFPLGPKVGESPKGENPAWVEFDHAQPTVLADGEVEFDHAPTDAELEKAFPGRTERIKRAEKVAAVRAAVAFAAHDDELATQIAAGTLNAADIPEQELADVNARRVLRGKAEIPR